MSRRPTDLPETRRERRRAERIAERDADRARAARKSVTPAWRTPTALITEAAILIGLLVVAILVLRPGSSSGGSAGSGDLPLGLVRPATTIPAGLQDGMSLGSAAAPVTVDTWADYQCPYCAQLGRDIEPRLISTFVQTGQARLVAHDFSFIGARSSSDESTAAAIAARCASTQGHYWDFAAYLWVNQQGENVGSFSKERLQAIADAVGLDRTKFDACQSDATIRSAVTAETARGVSLGITSTPTLFINGQLSKGASSYEQLATLIRQAAGSASPAPVGSSSSAASGSASPTASPSAAP